MTEKNDKKYVVHFHFPYGKVSTNSMSFDDAARYLKRAKNEDKFQVFYNGESEYTVLINPQMLTYVEIKEVWPL